MRRRALLRAGAAGVGALALPARSLAAGGRARYREIARWNPMVHEDRWSNVHYASRILHDMYVQGDYAYLAYWDSGAWILDVSDPSSPEYVARVGDYTYEDLVGFQEDNTVFDKYSEAPGNAHYVAVDDDASLMGVGAEGWDDESTDVRGTGGIDLYDVSDHANPERGATIDPPRADDETRGGTWVTSHNFELHGDRLYSSWYQGGVKIHDVSSPADPELLAWWRMPEEARFWTAQLAQPGDFFVASSYDHGTTAGALYTFPDRAGSQTDPPTLSEQHDNETPTSTDEFSPLGRVEVDGAAEAVVGPDGETAYLAASDGFAVVDVSDPADPTVLVERRDLMADHRDGPLRSILDVAVEGDRLIVPGPAQSGALRGFLVYDVSDPADPTQVGEFYETAFPIHNAYLSDGNAYLTAINGRGNPLVVVDVSDPGPGTTTTTTTTTVHRDTTTTTTTTTPPPTTPTTTSPPPTTTTRTGTTAGGSDGDGEGAGDNDGDGGGSQGLPGFGITAAVAGLGLGAWRYVQRRRRE